MVNNLLIISLLLFDSLSKENLKNVDSLDSSKLFKYRTFSAIAVMLVVIYSILDFSFKGIAGESNIVLNFLLSSLYFIQYSIFNS